MARGAISLSSSSPFKCNRIFGIVRWDAQGAANERSACGHQDYSLWGFTMKMSKLGYFSEFLLFPSLVLLATPAGVSQLKPASARDLGACLWYRTFWLDLYRISAASRALSPRSGSLANTRTAPSLPA